MYTSLVIDEDTASSNCTLSIMQLLFKINTILPASHCRHVRHRAFLEIVAKDNAKY